MLYLVSLFAEEQIYLCQFCDC